MPGTTPRETVRAAFKAILQAANLGVHVYDRMPYEGAEQRSVVLTLVSGSSRHGALGDQTLPNQRALEEQYRLQVDCYHDDQVECGKLADAVEQAIMDNRDAFEATYDIHNISKVLDIDTTPPDPTLRETRILMDFQFYTHRAVT